MDGCVLAHGHKGREKEGMELFERLVNEQLKTMEQLLFLQSEIERCQEIEKQLIELQQEAKLQSLQEEIRQMKQQLKEIQQRSHSCLSKPASPHVRAIFSVVRWLSFVSICMFNRYNKKRSSHKRKWGEKCRDILWKEKLFKYTVINIMG
jgi:DNA repair exonuclease SbcCD ATPase subunit